MHTIAVIPGDGTGPEVIAEGIKVLNAVSRIENFKIEFVFYDFGGDRYLRTGEVLPNSALEEFRKMDAIKIFQNLFFNLFIHSNSGNTLNIFRGHTAKVHICQNPILFQGIRQFNRKIIG